MMPHEDFSSLAQVDLKKVRADVQNHGWHLVLITGGNNPQADPGFLFTVGLWKTFGHPEILLFTPQQVPEGLARNVYAIVERVKQGERFEANRGYDGLFGSRGGAFRPVHSKWYPVFIGTAMAFYQGLTFPVLQLFWSDREGRFPWEKGVDPTILPFQPLLEEALLSRANLPLAVLGELEVPSSYADLFIDLSPEARELVLEEWRWLVGADAKVFRITVFGDLFIETKAGHIHFLDTGWGSCEEVAESAEQWAEKVKLHGPDWFHIGVLLDLRSLGMALNSRQVYSWAQLPMLGGAETVDNVNLVDGEVHISFSARVAEAIKDLPPGTAIEEIRWTPLGPKDA